VSGALIASYDTDIVEGNDIRYLGRRANACASIPLPARIAASSLSVASGLARRNAHHDHAVDCEGTADV
jgi:hypothetical protein